MSTGISLLMIDDDQQILSSTAQWLKMLGHSVYTAVNLHSAYSLLKSHNLDMILTDLRLGPENGLDILHYCKNNAIDTPVVIISGHAGVQEAVSALKSGALDFLTKPLLDETLLGLIERIKKMKASEHIKSAISSDSPNQDSETANMYQLSYEDNPSRMSLNPTNSRNHRIISNEENASCTSSGATETILNATNGVHYPTLSLEVKSSVLKPSPNAEYSNHEPESSDEIIHTLHGAHNSLKNHILSSPPIQTSEKTAYISSFSDPQALEAHLQECHTVISPPEVLFPESKKSTPPKKTSGTLKRQQARRENSSETPENSETTLPLIPPVKILGNDPAMKNIFEMIDTIADTRATVLITGESGTGKSMIARAIHRKSRRANNAFVEVACGALSETLLESELFGHVAGAFTGATRDKTGRFLQANGGTIFLDEIATASTALQIKLLRVLQDLEFEPVGGIKTYRVNTRVILATNEDLSRAVYDGRFRQDLFYRINVINIELPSLRERSGDIPILAQAFLDSIQREVHRPIYGFAQETMNILQRHPWPGNVRELQNVVERAVLLGKHSWIMPDDLPNSVFRIQTQGFSSSRIQNPQGKEFYDSASSGTMHRAPGETGSGTEYLESPSARTECMNGMNRMNYAGTSKGRSALGPAGNTEDFFPSTRSNNLLRSTYNGINGNGADAQNIHDSYHRFYNELNITEETSLHPLHPSMSSSENTSSQQEDGTGKAHLKDSLCMPERQIILDALIAHNWNRIATSAALGINRTTLYKKMKKHQLKEPEKKR